MKYACIINKNCLSLWKLINRRMIHIFSWIWWSQKVPLFAYKIRSVAPVALSIREKNCKMPHAFSLSSYLAPNHPLPRYHNTFLISLLVVLSFFYLFIRYILPTLQRQNTEISKQIFPEKEYRGLSPNFHIHAPVIDLYIPKIGLPILLEEICRPILGLYKSLTYTRMWNWGWGRAIPRKGIYKWDFRCSVRKLLGGGGEGGWSKIRRQKEKVASSNISFTPTSVSFTFRLKANL
jgi:hypothetical protein